MAPQLAHWTEPLLPFPPLALPRLLRLDGNVITPKLQFNKQMNVRLYISIFNASQG